MERGKVISLAQAKGGVGKSTLSANLAITFGQTQSVMLIDCDAPQHSLSLWFELRGEDEHLDVKEAATPAQLVKEVNRAITSHDIVILDGPPHINKMTRAILALSDLAIVPLSPSPVEVWSSEDYLELLEEAQKLNPDMQFRVCWNRVRSRTSSSSIVMADTKKQLKLKEFKTRLSYRVSYIDSFAEGLSVAEWHDAAAKLEIWALHNNVRRALNSLGKNPLISEKRVKEFI